MSFYPTSGQPRVSVGNGRYSITSWYRYIRVFSSQLGRNFSHFDVELQWHNRLARRTYRQYLPRAGHGRELCGGCEFEPHLEQVFCTPEVRSFRIQRSLLFGTHHKDHNFTDASRVKVWQRWDSNPRLRGDWCLKPAP